MADSDLETDESKVQPDSGGSRQPDWAHAGDPRYSVAEGGTGGVPAPPPQADYGAPLLAPSGQAPDAFIVHHTGGRGSPEDVVADWRTNRPGIGSQYIVDRDGTLVQTKRDLGYGGTSHMINGSGKGAGLSNRNTVGVEVVANDNNDVTDAQEATIRGLARQNYSNVPVYGHGEVNPGHREADEGMRIVGAIRGERGVGQPGGLPGDFVNAIKESEGFAPRAAWDRKQFTSGYGTRASYPGEPIDRETADRRFSSEITQAAQVVDAVNPKLDPGTRAAMTSLTFNAGESWVHSDLGERIRAGDIEGARNAFQQYNRAGGAVNPGLAARRGREAAWFGAGGFVPEGAQLSRQGLAQMPVTFPGRMAVKSDTSNFPPSSNIDDRRQPGPIQRSKDAINDAYLATRAMLGMGPMPPRYANVKNPDDRLGSVQDIRDRVGVIRERQQQEKELFDQAHTDYKTDSDAYFAEREANEAAVSKYHTDLDSYLTDLMKAATKGQQAKFVKQRGPVPPPPADMSRKHPDPENYFGDTARYKIYNKLNPE